MPRENLVRHFPLELALAAATAGAVACRDSNSLVGPDPTVAATVTARTTTTPVPTAPATPTRAATTPTTAGPAPSKTPPPSISISGTWSGTFATSDAVDCAPAVVALALPIDQQGAAFETALPDLPCGFSGILNATLIDGNVAQGTAEISGTVMQTGASGGAVSGSLDPLGIHLTIGALLHTLPNHTIEVHPGGQLELHR